MNFKRTLGYHNFKATPTKNIFLGIQRMLSPQAEPKGVQQHGNVLPRLPSLEPCRNSPCSAAVRHSRGTGDVSKLNITANSAKELGCTPHCSTPLQICCKPERAQVAACPGGTAGLTDPGTHPASLTRVLLFET